MLLEPSSEKAMAPHSSTLAWKIPGTGEPGELLSMGSHRVGHSWSDLAAAAAAEPSYKKKKKKKKDEHFGQLIFSFWKNLEQ